MKIYNQEKRIFEEKRYIEFDMIEKAIAFNTVYQDDKLKDCKYLIINFIKYGAFTYSQIVQGISDVVNVNGITIIFALNKESGSIEARPIDVDPGQYAILSIHILK